MVINKKEALVILEMIGKIDNYAGNTGEEELLDTKIRHRFPEVYDYDYIEEAKKYGWDGFEEGSD